VWIFCLVWHVKVEWIANWFLCIVTFNNHIAAHWIEVIWCSSFVILNKIDWYIENQFFSCSYCDVILNILCNEFMPFPIVKGWIDNRIYITSHISIWDIENTDFEIHVEAIVITTVLFDGDTDGLSFRFSRLYQVCHHYGSIADSLYWSIIGKIHPRKIIKLDYKSPIFTGRLLSMKTLLLLVLTISKLSISKFEKSWSYIGHIFKSCILKSMTSPYSKLQSTQNFDIVGLRRLSSFIESSLWAQLKLNPKSWKSIDTYSYLILIRSQGDFVNFERSSSIAIQTTRLVHLSHLEVKNEFKKIV